MEAGHKGESGEREEGREDVARKKLLINDAVKVHEFIGNIAE